jgi:hypothetical protein
MGRSLSKQKMSIHQLSSRGVLHFKKLQICDVAGRARNPQPAHRHPNEEIQRSRAGLLISISRSEAAAIREIGVNRAAWHSRRALLLLSRALDHLRDLLVLSAIVNPFFRSCSVLAW